MKAFSAIALLVVALSSVSEGQQPATARPAFSVTLRRIEMANAASRANTFPLAALRSPLVLGGSTCPS